MSSIELGSGQPSEGVPILPKRDLTPQEATILWAHQVFDEYSALPQANHRQRAKAERFVSEVASQVIEDPEKLGIAASVWKSREAETPEGKRTFYSHVAQEASVIAKESWNAFSSEQLASLVGVLAHNELASEVVRDVLKSYFKGPKNLRERVDSLYDFTYGVLDLIDDKEALEEGVRIINFLTDILPRDSTFFRDFVTFIWTINNDELLGKGCRLDHVRFQLSFLTSLDPEQVKNKLKGSSREMEENSHRYKQSMVKKLGPEEAKKRFDALNRFYSVTGDFLDIDLETAVELKKTWPSNVILRASDPLTEKYSYTAKRRIIERKVADDMRAWFQEHGKNQFTFLRVVTPDGFSLEIYFPEQLTSQKRADLIRFILKREPLSEEDKADMKRDQAFFNELDIPGEPYKARSEVFEGLKFEFSYEIISGSETNMHPILSLETIGFPVPILADGLSVRELNEVYAKQIRENQIRYLNRRGIRVPLKAEELRDLGYSYVDFYRDERKTRVEISVNGLTYAFKLDANYNLDFEGKSFDSPMLADFLRYITLSLLRPILCDERLKGEKDEEISQEEREVVTRMGHLRWLPLGQKYTKQAEENYLQTEGGDLAVKNLERKLEAERNSSPHVGHTTTYVRPVTEPEENLPPLILNLAPDIIKFK